MPDSSETDYTKALWAMSPDDLARHGESLAAALLARHDSPGRSLNEMRAITVELRQVLLVLRNRVRDVA